MTQQLVSKRVLAELMGISTRTIDRMVAAGVRLGRVKIPGHHPRFDLDQLGLAGVKLRLPENR